MANVAVLAAYPVFHGFYPDGAPLIGGKLYTYDAGTTTPRACYHDAAATQPWTNPIVLNAVGEAVIYIVEPMRWLLTDADGVEIWTVDNIGGSGAVIPPANVGVDNVDTSVGVAA